MRDNIPMASEFDSQPWFRAKRVGYGAGLPIAWQGWVMLLAHGLALAGATILLRDTAAWIHAVVIVLVALLPMPLYRAKTEGGWHWRR